MWLYQQMLDQKKNKKNIQSGTRRASQSWAEKTKERIRFKRIENKYLSIKNNTAILSEKVL